jgi:hypothetical protein
LDCKTYDLTLNPDQVFDDGILEMEFDKISSILFWFKCSSLNLFSKIASDDKFWFKISLDLINQETIAGRVVLVQAVPEANVCEFAPFGRSNRNSYLLTQDDILKN